MQTNSWHYSTFIYPFESGKCQKEEKNHENLNILRTKRDKIKKVFFIVFEQLSYGEKIKNSGHKF